MPINLQGSGNIAEGWGKAPELDAPALGPLVASILANKLARDKMLQEGIGETIKNVREERQGNALLESMKAQGLVPEGYDAGGLGGAKLGVGLAKMIQEQQEFQAREEHRRAMETRVGGRGGRGSRGDGGVTPSAEPQTVWKDGVEWRPGPGGRWIPMKPAGGTKTGGGTDVSKLIKEQGKLLEEKGYMDAEKAKQEAEDIKALRPDVPFKRSDEYNRTVNRLKQLQEVPGMPSTEPAVPQRPPAETGDTTMPPGVKFVPGPSSEVLPPSGADKNVAPNYGVQGVKMKAPDGTVKTVDPTHVDYYKAKGAVIVP